MNATQTFRIVKLLCSAMLLLFLHEEGRSLDTLLCSPSSYKINAKYTILIDSGYTFDQAKDILLNTDYTEWQDPGKLSRSFNKYWVAVILKNNLSADIPMHAEGYIEKSWLDSIPSNICNNLPCSDVRGILVQKHNLISHFDLPPGDHIFIAKISDFHLPKDFTPSISSSFNFDSRVMIKEAPKFFFFSVFAGMVLLLSIFSIFIFYRIKDKSFLFYGIYCFLLFYNTYRVLAENFELFHWDAVYIPWVYSKMFLAISFFVCYVQFVVFFLEAKDKYPRFYKIARVYCMISLMTLLPEIILLSNGNLALSYSYYFTTRMVLGVIGIGLIFLLLKHYKDRYVLFILLGSSFLLMGELVSSLSNNNISSMIASGGAMIDLVIFTFGLAYKIYKYNQSKNEYLIDVINKTEEIAELTIEKSTLNMNLLQAQMNPHFIFNSLNSINRYILKSDKDNASNYLSKFSKLIRFILDHSTKSQITLTDEIDALVHYMDLEKIRFSDRFDYNISIGENVNMDETFLPPLIIQPFVENSIIHGFSTKKTMSHLIIKISLNNKTLKIEITDNGIGRKEAKSDSSLKTKFTMHDSKGQQITFDRIKSFAEKNDGSFEYEIIDLQSKNQTANGTSIILSITSEKLFSKDKIAN